MGSLGDVSVNMSSILVNRVKALRVTFSFYSRSRGFIGPATPEVQQVGLGVDPGVVWYP